MEIFRTLEVGLAWRFWSEGGVLEVLWLDVWGVLYLFCELNSRYRKCESRYSVLRADCRQRGRVVDIGEVRVSVSRIIGEVHECEQAFCSKPRPINGPELRPILQIDRDTFLY